MAKKFSDLRAKMTQERQEKIRARTDALLAEMPLHELRRAREMTQKTLAEMMERDQATISQIEHRTDVYVSTLRRYIEAMGGELRIVASFPDGDVTINQFEEPV